MSEQLSNEQPLFAIYSYCNLCRRIIGSHGKASHGLAHVRRGEAIAKISKFGARYVFFVKGGAS